MTEQDDSLAELLAALDELYPLPDDDKRAERAGRTAAVLKRWRLRESEWFQAEITRAILRYTVRGYTAGENADAKHWRTRAEEAEAKLGRHYWTTSTDLNKCDICGDGPWGRHRFEKQS